MLQATETNSNMKIIKWARKHGALLIKVGDIELTFPPDIDYREATASPVASPVSNSKESNAAAAEEFIRTNSALDDPDYYASEQERWLTSKPLPNL